jgi:hypothetical protein
MAKRTPLWQARYLNVQPTDTASLFKDIPPIPPWTANMLIQFTGDGVGPVPHTLDGLEDGADLDAFDGTYNQLAAIWPGLLAAAHAVGAAAAATS